MGGRRDERILESMPHVQQRAIANCIELVSWIKRLMFPLIIIALITSV